MSFSFGVTGMLNREEFPAADTGHAGKGLYLGMPLCPPRGAGLGQGVLSILSEPLPQRPKPRHKQKMMDGWTHENNK